MAEGPIALIREHFPDYSFSVILDVGANVGQSSVLMAKVAPEAAIFALEPVLDAFRALSTRTNELPAISAHRLALTNRIRRLEMTAVGESTMNRVSRTSSGSLLVPSMTLDRFVRIQSIGNISFLKIDTEGHDLHVLQGGKKALGRTHFVEVETSMNFYNRFHVPFGKVQKFLWRRGFLLLGLSEMVHEWQNGGRPVLRRANALFVNSSLVGPLDVPFR